MVGPLDQVFRGNPRFFFRLMRMGPDRTPDVVVAFRNRTDLFELADPGADGHQRANAGVAGAADGFGAVVIEDVEIEVAMAVDKQFGGSFKILSRQ
jgi:hypothetical protein